MHVQHINHFETYLPDPGVALRIDKVLAGTVTFDLTTAPEAGHSIPISRLGQCQNQVVRSLQCPRMQEWKPSPVMHL